MGELILKYAVSEIGRILETAGYDCELEEGPYNISAVKGDKCILVMCCEDKDMLGRFDMTPYTIMLNGVKTRCDKIIFAGNANFQAKESELWTREKFGRYIEESAFARMFNEPFDIVSAPSYAYPGPTPAPLMPGYDLILPIRISAKDAVRVARQDGPTVLRMIPYWRYRYVSVGEASYKGKSVCFDEEGQGWINAVNGTPGDFDENTIPEPKEIPQDADVVPIMKTKDVVREEILATLIKKLTRRVRIKTTSGDAIFAEERDFKPNEDNIELKFEKVYVPVWQVRGKKDIVEVNAYTGFELTVPSDEGCEVF